jgi:hypothetical protein
MQLLHQYFFPDKVDSDRVVMGTNSNPNPIPLKINAQYISSSPVLGVLLCIIKVNKKKTKTQHQS